MSDKKQQATYNVASTNPGKPYDSKKVVIVNQQQKQVNPGNKK